MDEDKINTIASSFADETNTDVLLYNGPIEKSFDEKVIDECQNTKRRENVILILCTFGGDPDVGYRLLDACSRNIRNLPFG